MRLTESRKGNLLTVHVKFSRKEEINSAELSYFSSKSFKAFLRPVQERKKLIVYKGLNGISLLEYLKRPMSETDFFSLIEQITDATIELRNHQFPLTRVIWNMEHVYINDLTKEIELIYVPTEQKVSDTQILVFFVRIMNTLQPTDSQDCEYLRKFYRFLQTQSSYQPEEIEGYIEKVNRSIVRAVKRRQVKDTGLTTYAPSFEGTEKTSDHFPKLIRVSTGMVTELIQTVYGIGRDHTWADLVIDHNDSVSRRHAQLIRRGDRVYLKDLGSKNHTFLNGNQIPVGVETTVPNGSEIRLAGELFVLNRFVQDGGDNG